MMRVLSESHNDDGFDVSAGLPAKIEDSDQRILALKSAIIEAIKSVPNLTFTELLLVIEMEYLAKDILRRETYKLGKQS